MKENKNKPPVYFFQDENKAKKKTFVLLKTGAKSYAMSFMNLMMTSKTDTDYNESLHKKKG